MQFEYTTSRLKTDELPLSIMSTLNNIKGISCTMRWTGHFIKTLTITINEDETSEEYKGKTGIVKLQSLIESHKTPTNTLPPDF